MDSAFHKAFSPGQDSVMLLLREISNSHQQLGENVDAPSKTRLVLQNSLFNELSDVSTHATRGWSHDHGESDVDEFTYAAPPSERDFDSAALRSGGFIFSNLSLSFGLENLRGGGPSDEPKRGSMERARVHVVDETDILEVDLDECCQEAYNLPGRELENGQRHAWDEMFLQREELSPGKQLPCVEGAVRVDRSETNAPRTASQIQQMFADGVSLLNSGDALLGDVKVHAGIPGAPLHNEDFVEVDLDEMCAGIVASASRQPEEEKLFHSSQSRGGGPFEGNRRELSVFEVSEEDQQEFDLDELCGRPAVVSDARCACGREPQAEEAPRFGLCWQAARGFFRNLGGARACDDDTLVEMDLDEMCALISHPAADHGSRPGSERTGRTAAKVQHLRYVTPTGCLLEAVLALWSFIHWKVRRLC
mmetsp:Transcript_53640/g.143472  ORF Transcript_53640/g.143472 Transcript_53640/m.143472 type:complete len:421 (-) Transcript_53640:315-1577(-)